MLWPRTPTEHNMPILSLIRNIEIWENESKNEKIREKEIKIMEIEENESWFYKWNWLIYVIRISTQIKGVLIMLKNVERI